MSKEAIKISTKHRKVLSPFTGEAVADPRIFEGGADEKNQAKEGADGTKMRTFRRKLLEKKRKIKPKGDAAAPTAPPWIRH